jgi:ribonuclease VapC
VTRVADASALLAFLQGEDGADVVERALDDDAICGAANWSEVAQEVRAGGGDWDLARALLESYGVGVADVTADDAEWAAGRWRRAEGLSLADRLCLAVGDRLGATILTADTAWGDEPPIIQIR